MVVVQDRQSGKQHIIPQDGRITERIIYFRDEDLGFHHEFICNELNPQQYSIWAADTILWMLLPHIKKRTANIINDEGLLVSTSSTATRVNNTFVYVQMVGPVYNLEHAPSARLYTQSGSLFAPPLRRGG